MDEKQKQIADLKTKITNLESDLQAAKRALFDLTKDEHSEEKTDPLSKSSNEKIIEGVFNGENMVGPEEKIYPVPANYASKSKLVEGDRLKLTINPDGSFVFKQIGPVERKNIIGELKFENNAYHVEAEGNNYSVLYASVTYHKAKPGDKVVIVIPAVGEPHWSVLESIIHDISPEDKAAAEKVLEDKVSEEMKSPIVPDNNGTSSNELPAEAHLAPDYTTTDNGLQESASDTSALNINDIEIKGPKGTPVPEAVSPTGTAPGADSQVTPTPTVDNDDRAGSVSELEI